MRAKSRLYSFQLIGGFDVVPQLQPAVGGAEMVSVGVREGFHCDCHRKNIQPADVGVVTVLFVALLFTSSV